jgi:hypothetical protein
MSHLRRVVALVLLAVMGWFVALGAVGAVAASASISSSSTRPGSDILCC